MTKRINPFQPNSPVHQGMFVGRLAELEIIEAALLQAKAGSPKHFIVTGERGIGKTSILNVARWEALGQIPVEGETINFLVVHTDVEPSTTQLGLVKKVELGLQHALADSEAARNFLKNAWGFVSRLEAFGVKLREVSSDLTPETLLDEFAYSLSHTIGRVCDNKSNLTAVKYDGLLLLLDECDNAPPALHLGSFLKLLLEKLQRAGCDRFTVGLAGLPRIREVLLESHESSLRLFDEVRLERLSADEVSQVVDRCLAKANESAERPTTIDEAGRRVLIHFAEGYPHFIQQFGYSAFEKDSDYKISQEDVFDGALGPRGALDRIGDRYYRNDFYNKIQKDSYRQVLRIMADGLDSWITKTEIRKRFRGTESTLSNALHALRSRRIILTKEGTKATYRLQHKGFAHWIKLYTADPSEMRRGRSGTEGGLAGR
jgi:hypothetical protein